MSGQYNLTTLFYETVTDDSKYLTVLVTRRSSKSLNLEELRGKRVCFPSYDGVAWNTVKHILLKKKIISKCTLDNEMAEFFGPSCAPGLPQNAPKSLGQICEEETFDGEYGALHCLSSGMGEVAFVSSNSVRAYMEDPEDTPGQDLKPDDLPIVCMEQPCHLSWAPAGYGMVWGYNTDLWMKDTLDVFLRLDNLFGKYYKSLTTPFTMFGPYDNHSDLLFHDATVKLRNVPTFKDTDTMIHPYEEFLDTDKLCTMSSGFKISSFSVIILAIIVLPIRYFI